MAIFGLSHLRVINNVFELEVALSGLSALIRRNTTTKLLPQILSINVTR